MKIKNPNLWKIMMLVMMVAIVSAGTAVVNYAHGAEVIEDNQHMFMVSHTEYRYGEAGQVVVRLVDYQGDAISVTNCTASILYPDKTFFVQNALMNDSVNIAGDHYYNFTTPQGPEGVYEYQATCYYGINKERSATNSFHLSSAFNTIIDDLTAINTTIVDFRTEVQSNFSDVLASISDINVSAEVAEIQANLLEVNTTVTSISSDLTSFVSDTQSRLDEINVTTQSTATIVASLQSDLTALNTTIITRFDEVDAYMASNFTALTTDISDLSTLLSAVNLSIIEAIDAIDVDVNLTPVLDEIAAINLSITSDISSLATVVESNQNDTVDWLTLINSTTLSTYEYVTGTLATNVNSILGTLGVINATVNRIEANTVEINDTVSTIKQNQEDEVFISTFSG